MFERFNFSPPPKSQHPSQKRGRALPLHVQILEYLYDPTTHTGTYFRCEGCHLDLYTDFLATRQSVRLSSFAQHDGPFADPSKTYCRFCVKHGPTWLKDSYEDEAAARKAAKEARKRRRLGLKAHTGKEPIEQGRLAYNDPDAIKRLEAIQAAKERALGKP